MKKVLLLFVIIICSSSIYGQKLVLTPNGFEPVVYIVDSIKAPTIYKRALDWVQVTYINPKECLKANVENETLRIEGFCEKAFPRTFKDVVYKGKIVSEGNVSYYGLLYTLEINIKDGKYRFNFIPTQIVTDDGTKIFNFGIPDFFSGKEDINGNTYEGCASSLESSTNTLSLSLYNYILGKKENDNW